MQTLIEAVETYCEQLETEERRRYPHKYYRNYLLGITEISENGITFKCKIYRCGCCESEIESDYVGFQKLLDSKFITQEIYDLLTFKKDK